MRRIILILIGAGVLLTPQLSAIADEKETIATNSEQELLSHNEHIQSWLSRGNDELEAGNYNRALAFYDQAIAIEEQPLIWERRGDALREKGEYRAAIESYHQAIHLRKETPNDLEEKMEMAREEYADQF